PSDISPGDWRHNSPRFQGENFAKNLAIVERLEAIAGKKRCTSAQLALAWLLRHDDVVPIPGSTSHLRVEENARAVDLQLTAEEAGEIEAAAPLNATAGARYPSGGMALLGK